MKRSFWVMGFLVTQFAQPAQAQNGLPAASPYPSVQATNVAASTYGSESQANSDSSYESSPLPTDRAILLDDPMLAPIEQPEHVITDWQDAIAHVRSRSTDYRIALSQIDAARGQSRMALANALPTLDGTGNVQKHLIHGLGANQNNLAQGLQPSRIPNPDSFYNLGATLRVPVISARNWYDYATSQDTIDQRKLQAADAQRLIIGGLAEAMVTVITAERLAEVTRVNLAAALSTLDLNQRRTSLGAGNSIDVLRARQEVEGSRAQLVQADETVRKARESLGMALGYPEPWGITPNIKLDQLRQDAKNSCKTSSAIQDRSDVRAAAAGAAIAKRNVRAVDFSFLPTLDAVSTITYNSYIVPTNRRHSTWTIGASLTWHLYDGGRRYGEKTLNSALLEQSQQTGLQVERTATIEVRQAVRGVNVAKQSLDVAAESRKIADDNANLARAKFLNGTGNSFDLVDTQRAARQTKLDMTVKEFELLRAEIVAFLALAACEI